MRAAARDDRRRARHDLHERAELAHDWAAARDHLPVGVTGTQTPAAMALHLGQGVCQDYAHIMLSLLRPLGIPAATSRATCSARARRTPGSRCC